MTTILCRHKSLPSELLIAAERRAIEINPANASERRSVFRTAIGRRHGPRRLAVLVGRKWPPTGVRLSVSFMDSPSAALRSRVLKHMNAWGEAANVRFSETRGPGKVRIARLDSPPAMAGYWSYIGTEILEIPDDEPTLNLEGFTVRVSDAEFRRVVRHEAGHTLGFEHEHMRRDLVNMIDARKAKTYFRRSQGWSAEEVEAQVLTPLSDRSIMGTLESDPLSIMCYQLPAAIMKKNQKAILGGKDINPNDHVFAASLYPKADSPPSRPSEHIGKTLSQTPTQSNEERDTFHIIVMDEFAPGDSVADSAGKGKLAHVLAMYGGARVMSAIRLRADRGKVTKLDEIIRMHERIKKYTRRESGSPPDEKELITFGTNLFETLIQGDVRRLYDEARVRQRRRRLDLVLTSMIPWIAEKPWEFAYDSGRCSFLATEDVHFVRNVLTSIPSDPIQQSTGTLRILVAAAQPVGFGRLSIDQEIAVIRRGFEPLIEAGLVTVEVLARASPSRIHGYLSTGRFQIAHFIGHGADDEKRQEGCLIFETEPGREYPVGEREAREIFCGRELSLVFLNACETGRGGRADFNKGIAQSLVAHGLPAVVANQYSVLDSSATAFARHFYWSLSQGMSLGESAREARIAVNYSLDGQSIDWAVPVVYARDPHASLCEMPTRQARAPAVAARRSFRRAFADRQGRIAVWDIDEVFPSIERTLEVMNAGQTVFGFELLDLSVPLDAWDLDTDEHTPYLVAERLAKRLASKPAELGVGRMRHPPLVA